jgi:hypothetical protein
MAGIYGECLVRADDESMAFLVICVPVPNYPASVGDGWVFFLAPPPNNRAEDAATDTLIIASTQIANECLTVDGEIASTWIRMDQR